MMRFSNNELVDERFWDCWDSSSSGDEDADEVCSDSELMYTEGIWDCSNLRDEVCSDSCDYRSVCSDSCDYRSDCWYDNPVPDSVDNIMTSLKNNEDNS